jgi:small subunit ribosomal protein S16
MGLKGQPSYRLVVCDQRSPRNGSFIEVIGFHNPRTQPVTDIVEEARALHWLNVGAQPSEAARRVLQRAGTLARLERMRKGESVEALAAEAAAAHVSVSPKTRYPSPESGKGTMKKAQA